jgi:hypothetical protein
MINSAINGWIIFKSIHFSVVPSSSKRLEPGRLYLSEFCAETIEFFLVMRKVRLVVEIFDSRGSAAKSYSSHWPGMLSALALYHALPHFGRLYEI